MSRDPFARPIYSTDGALLGWVQQMSDRLWLARSIETGSSNTEHATLDEAVTALGGAR